MQRKYERWRWGRGGVLDDLVGKPHKWMSYEWSYYYMCRGNPKGNGK
jgi:hypothetical protein